MRAAATITAATCYYRVRRCGRVCGDTAGYWYRDDSLDLWDAIWAFVEQVLSLYYDDDVAVISDIELTAVISELRQHSITSLVRTLVACLEFPKAGGGGYPHLIKFRCLDSLASVQ